jgi:hypothetical protein
LIITMVDGINVQVVMDGLGSKTIRAVLQEITTEQCVRAAQKLAMDGHPLNYEDVKTICDQYVVVMRKFCNAMSEKEPTEGKEAVITPKSKVN